jgi:hypothetical protein
LGSGTGENLVSMLSLFSPMTSPASDRRLAAVPDGFSLLAPCYTPPFLRNSSQMAGISRVCTEASNTPDTFWYTHFLPLMRRTISLRIPWDLRPTDVTA